MHFAATLSGLSCLGLVSCLMEVLAATLQHCNTATLAHCNMEIKSAKCVTN